VTEISERYARLADVFAANVAAVPDDGWANPTPCEQWTARDIVRHVVSSQGMFLGFIGEELGDIPSVDDDPVSAWDAARAKVQASLDDPGRAQTEYTGFTGTSTFEEGVGRFLCTDLVVHGWDLARATGLDERIDPEDVDRVWAVAKGFGDVLRSPQAFGPEVEPPPDADDQQRLLAVLGRRP